MATERIDHMLQERAAKIKEWQDILALADTEKRDLTGEEITEANKREEEFKLLDQAVESYRSLNMAQATLETAATPADIGRRTQYSEFEALVETRSGKPYADAFRTYCSADPNRGVPREAMDVLDEVERRADTLFLEGTNSVGGYLVPTEFERTLFKFLYQVSGVRQTNVKVLETAAGNPLLYPRRTAIGAAEWTAEAQATNATADTYDQVTLSAYMSDRPTIVSIQLLQDAAFDLATELGESIYTAIGILQNTAFVSGNGSGKPTGILDATSGIQTGVTTTAGQTTSVTANDLMSLVYSVAPQYRRGNDNLYWLFNDVTVGAVRRLQTGVSGDKTFLWAPGLSANEPDRLLGYPVVVDPDIPTMAASAKAIIFGDFSHYTIRQVNGLRIVRLNERYMDKLCIGFVGFHRVDGKFTGDPKALKALTLAAS